MTEAENKGTISAEEQRYYEIEALKGRFADMEEALGVDQGIRHSYLTPAVVTMRDESGRVVLPNDTGA